MNILMTLPLQKMQIYLCPFQVAQLATTESAVLSQRAELGAEKAEITLERREEAMLETESHDIQVRGAENTKGW